MNEGISPRRNRYMMPIIAISACTIAAVPIIALARDVSDRQGVSYTAPHRNAVYNPDISTGVDYSTDTDAGFFTTPSALELSVENTDN